MLLLNPHPYLNTIMLRLRRYLKLALIFSLSCSLILLSPGLSWAQFSLPDGLFQQENPNQPPKDVIRYGSIEVTAVKSPINGDRLFEIASATVYNRSLGNDPNTLPVERRAKEVEAKLERAFERFVDYAEAATETEDFVVEISRLNKFPVIDVRSDRYPKPLILVTVTDIDADYHGKTIDELTNEWQVILEADLREGLEKLAPDNLLPILLESFYVLLGLIAATALILFLKHLINQKQKRLRQRRQDLQAELAASASEDIAPTPFNPTPETSPEEPVAVAIESESQPETSPHQWLKTLQHRFTLERQLSLWGFLQWFLFWFIVIAWYIGIYRIIRQFPVLQSKANYFLALPIELLFIWFVTTLGIRLSHRLVDRCGETWEQSHFFDTLNFGDAQRRRLRIVTIIGAVKGVVTVVLLISSLLWTLQVLGLPTSSVVAIGGLLALALSFGSQNLVQDLVNGFLILAEDQYAVGDVIDLGTVGGFVENLNLRVTQLRSGNGELVTIPNSKISQVKNLTRTWSRVNFSIVVNYQTDPEQALSVMREVSEKLYADPEWHEHILAEPQVLGIDAVSHEGIKITIWIQTAPGQQWAIGREFRFRVRRALEDHGIEIGVPRQTFQVEPTTQENNKHYPLEDAIAPSESPS